MPDESSDQSKLPHLPLAVTAAGAPAGVPEGASLESPEGVSVEEMDDISLKSAGGGII